MRELYEPAGCFVMEGFSQIVNPDQLPLSMFIAVVLVLCLVGAGMIVDVCLVVHVAASPPDWRRLIARIKSRPWSWAECRLILAILIVLQGLLILSVKMFGLAGADGPHLIPVLVQTFLFHAVGLGVIVFLVKTRKLSWRTAFGLDTRNLLRNIRQGVVSYLATVPVVCFSVWVYRSILTSLGYRISNQEVVNFLAGDEHPVWVRAYLAVVAVTLAPLVEELLFRGIALPLLSKHLRVGWAVCLVSVLFAAMHFHIPSVVPLFVMATAFALAYMYTGSILVPIVMHILFNQVTILATFTLRNTPLFE